MPLVIFILGAGYLWHRKTVQRRAGSSWAGDGPLSSDQLVYEIRRLVRRGYHMDQNAIAMIELVGVNARNGDPQARRTYPIIMQCREEVLAERAARKQSR